jgi:hypothetical protein
MVIFPEAGSPDIADNRDDSLNDVIVALVGSGSDSMIQQLLGNIPLILRFKLLEKNYVEQA